MPETSAETFVSALNFNSVSHLPPLLPPKGLLRRWWVVQRFCCVPARCVLTNVKFERKFVFNVVSFHTCMSDTDSEIAEVKVCLEKNFPSRTQTHSAAIKEKAQFRH